MISANDPARGRVRVGYTLVEMLLTIAVLIVVLGLMVSLARYVRDRSSQQLTRELLTELDGMLDQYRKANADQLPPVPAIALNSVHSDKPLPADEQKLLDSCKANNEALIHCLQWDYRLRQRTGQTIGKDPFADQPPSVYDHLTLRDAWGSPIVLMAGQHPLIGMAPSAAGQDQPFFFSAGPDRRYLTRDDNLYSYER